VPTLREDDIDLTSVPLSVATLDEADCVIVVTDHSGVDYSLVARHARVVVDTRNALTPIRSAS
jgi:UDP-N-acetyl-D-glucosamine dehydrogenase